MHSAISVQFSISVMCIFLYLAYHSHKIYFILNLSCLYTFILHVSTVCHLYIIDRNGHMSTYVEQGECG